jgi:hypothetical protein
LPVKTQRRAADDHIDENDAALCVLDARIADRTVPTDEAIALIGARRDLVDQRELQFDRAHERHLEALRFWSMVGFATAAVTIGTLFVFTDHAMAGFFLLGIGFYRLAPDFIKSVSDRMLGKPKDKANAE